ncbi:DoxX family protein [Amycolatopsis minnesotensis]
MLVLRVTVGFMFTSGAVGKLADSDAFAATFRASGIPFADVLAPVVAVLELLGGVALAIGVGTRVSALVLALVMVGALVTTIAPPLLEKHPAPISFLSNLFYQPEWLLIGLLGWWAFVGAERFSVDARLTSRRT